MSREPKPPRIPQARDFVWQSLRRMRSASLGELTAVTERPRNSVCVELRYLVRTGYVVVDKGTHRLVRDSGPKPPMFVMKRNTLLAAYDRNTRLAYGVDGAPAPPIVHRANWMAKVEPPHRSGERTRRARYLRERARKKAATK